LLRGFKLDDPSHVGGPAHAAKTCCDGFVKLRLKPMQQSIGTKSGRVYQVDTDSQSVETRSYGRDFGVGVEVDATLVAIEAFLEKAGDHTDTLIEGIVNRRKVISGFGG